MTTANIQCRLGGRPAEMLKASDWTIVEEPKPAAAEGQFVVLSITCRSIQRCAPG